MVILGMDLGPHWIVVLASYGLALAVIGGLIGWVLIDRSQLDRTLAALEASGVRRRSARPTDPDGGGA